MFGNSLSVSVDELLPISIESTVYISPTLRYLCAVLRSPIKPLVIFLTTTSLPLSAYKTLLPL